MNHLKSSISKAILTGEHAVVYGASAIAIPIENCKSFAKITSNNNEMIIKATQLNELYNFKNENLSPLETCVKNFFSFYQIPFKEKISLEVFSDIPIGSGMGSGASISASIIKSLASYFSIEINKEDLYKQVLEIEKIYHGNPSGIDQTVIIYEKPIFFIKNNPNNEILDINLKNYSFIIIDSKIKSSTIKVVNWIKEQKEKNLSFYDNLFKEIDTISKKSKLAIQNNNYNTLAELLNINHLLLQEMGVSCIELDEIVKISLESGAIGAKMSGAGWGGIVISLVEEDKKSYFIKKMRNKNLEVISSK
ncbi:MAG: mevalonate kinase [Candidatus Sericytochromatia bacterium]